MSKCLKPLLLRVSTCSFLILTLFCLPSSVYGQAPDNDAIWIWEGGVYYDTAYQDSFIHFCLENNIRYIYLNAGPYQRDGRTYRPLDFSHYDLTRSTVGKLHEHIPNVIVEALIGDYRWILPVFRSSGTRIMHDLMTYQQTHSNNPLIRFDGIHIDVEMDVVKRINFRPSEQQDIINYGAQWILGNQPSVEQQRRQIMMDFVDMVSDLKSVMTSFGPQETLPLSFDMGTNYDNGTVDPRKHRFPNAIHQLFSPNEMSYVELDFNQDGIYDAPGWQSVIDLFDHIVIMSYSDTSIMIIRMTEKERAYLDQTNKSFHVAYSFDKNHGNGGSVHPATTFFDNPYRRLRFVSANFESYLQETPSCQGIAYHSYAPYQEYLNAFHTQTPHTVAGTPYAFDPSFSIPEMFVVGQEALGTPTLSDPVPVRLNVLHDNNFLNLILEVRGPGYTSQRLSISNLKDNEPVSFLAPMERGALYSLRLFGSYHRGGSSYNISFVRRSLALTEPGVFNILLAADEHNNWVDVNRTSVTFDLPADIPTDGSVRVRLEQDNNTSRPSPYIIHSEWGIRQPTFINLDPGHTPIFLEHMGGVWTQLGSSHVVLKPQRLRKVSLRYDEDVIWVDHINTFTEDNDLVQDANIRSSWQSGAISQQTIVGDGGVVFEALQPRKSVLCGLSSYHYIQGPGPNVEYGIMLYRNATYYIYEKGKILDNPGPFQIGDLFSIERIRDTIHYKKNHEILLSRGTAPHVDLVVDASLDNSNGRIHHAKVFGELSDPHVHWLNTIHTAMDGHDLLQTVPLGRSWDTGAMSLRRIVGNGGVVFEAIHTAKSSLCGLSTVAYGQGPGPNVEYGIILYRDSKYYIYEKGKTLGTPGPFQIGDLFSVERIGDTLYYKKNNMVLLSSPQTGTDDLMADAAIDDFNGRIHNAKLFGELSDPRVRWTDTVKAMVVGHDLVQTTYDSPWRTGALSTRRIVGDGGVVFEASQPRKSIICGLSTFLYGHGPGPRIEYGIILYRDSKYYIREKGATLATPGPFQIGDLFSVERIGNTIYYKKNNEILFSSPQTNTDDLMADASHDNLGAHIHNAKLFGNISER